MHYNKTKTDLCINQDARFCLAARIIAPYLQVKCIFKSRRKSVLQNTSPKIPIQQSEAERQIAFPKSSLVEKKSNKINE